MVSVTATAQRDNLFSCHPLRAGHTAIIGTLCPVNVKVRISGADPVQYALGVRRRNSRFGTTGNDQRAGIPKRSGGRRSLFEHGTLRTQGQPA
jgi:hypothetical protein